MQNSGARERNLFGRLGNAGHFKIAFALLLASGKRGSSVLKKEAGYSTEGEIQILIDILTASILENEMCPGPFPGTETSWQETSWAPAARGSL